MAAQIARNAVVAWLLLAATCLADKLPSAAIESSGVSRHQGRHGDTEHYSTDEAVYGPLVPRMLGVHNQSGIFARAGDGTPGEDAYGPLLRVPGCLWCPEPNLAALTGRSLLESLTTQKMQSYMRIKRPNDLKNKCVFYSAALRKPPEHLSVDASKWACKYGKVSIWHLWPNKFMADKAGTMYKDFYGVFEETNWLHSITKLPEDPSDRGVPTTIQYFENMSEAMARTCSGEVVIMSQTPKEMDTYMRSENIWKNKERPALINLWRQNKITRFLVVDWNNMDDIYEFDIENNLTGGKVPASSLSRRDMDLHAREVCESTGLDQMPPQGDPFSDDYSQFA